MLDGHLQRLKQEREEELARRAREAIDQVGDQLPPPNRSVIPLLKMRVVPLTTPKTTPSTTPITTPSTTPITTPMTTGHGCILSVWRPSDDLQLVLKEGRAFRVTKLSASSGPSKHSSLPLQLTATRQTQFKQLSCGSGTCYAPRTCVSIGDLALSWLPSPRQHSLRSVPCPYGEFDTCGVVVLCVSSDVTMKDGLVCECMCTYV